jgi:hypothetical protein
LNTKRKQKTIFLFSKSLSFFLFSIPNTNTFLAFSCYFAIDLIHFGALGHFWHQKWHLCQIIWDIAFQELERYIRYIVLQYRVVHHIKIRLIIFMYNWLFSKISVNSHINFTIEVNFWQLFWQSHWIFSPFFDTF